MNTLLWGLRQLLNRHKDSSYTTQQDRKRILRLAARDLERLGFKRLSAYSLKPKHIWALKSEWDKWVTVSILQNRMAVLRWWAEKIGKSNIIPSKNRDLGIDKRDQGGTRNRAKCITQRDLAKIPCQRIQCSLQMQLEFGLRKAESIKFRPSVADGGNKIVLQGSWCKNGRPREIPIRNQTQRKLLDEVHRLVGDGALIPPYKNYRQQQNRYKKLTTDADLRNMHGLRYACAQARYQELTDHPPPIAGGKPVNTMSPEEYRADREARRIIVEELGHSRIEVSNNYLGK